MTTVNEIKVIQKLINLKQVELNIITKNLINCIAAGDAQNIKYFDKLSAETQTQINELFGRIAGTVQVELIQLQYRK